MAHKTYMELEEVLRNASNKVVKGAAYRHYKGGIYIVQNMAIVESNEDIAVLYVSETNPTVIFVRPLQSWLEDVELNGTITPRFTLLNELSPIQSTT